MLIVGENLHSLIKQEHICNEKNFDNTCISLSLGTQAIWLKPSENCDTLVYGDDIPEECIVKDSISEKGIIIPPHSAVIAASCERINMPIGYFGLVQTKGSLARMMVSVHFSDGQLDPGFNGNVTFEIMNGSDFSIQLRKRQIIANLYVFKTSTYAMTGYNGRYQNADGPTIFRAET